MKEKRLDGDISSLKAAYFYRVAIIVKLHPNKNGY